MNYDRGRFYRDGLIQNGIESNDDGDDDVKIWTSLSLTLYSPSPTDDTKKNHVM